LLLLLEKMFSLSLLIGLHDDADANESALLLICLLFCAEIVILILNKQNFNLTYFLDLN
jgi:hypothetical protein